MGCPNAGCTNASRGIRCTDSIGRRRCVAPRGNGLGQCVVVFDAHESRHLLCSRVTRMLFFVLGIMAAARLHDVCNHVDVQFDLLRQQSANCSGFDDMLMEFKAQLRDLCP